MKQEQQAGGATPQLVHNAAQSRYELRLDGELAGQAQYRREGDAIRLTHTEVEKRHEGQGLATRLAAFALDDLKASGSKVVPSCPFIARYIERHQQDYADLVAR